MPESNSLESHPRAQGGDGFADLVGAVSGGKLSSAMALLIESHCAACAGCWDYFDALRNAGNRQSVDPPEEIRSHMLALMETLPPGEEFFLA